MIFTIHPLADAELTDGTSYYAEAAGAELAESFVAEFARSVELIRSHPKIGAPWRGRLRRLPLRRFSCSIVDRESETAVRIVALAHQRRRPGYVLGRE